LVEALAERMEAIGAVVWPEEGREGNGVGEPRSGRSREAPNR
jgi:hypothetical protein